MIKRSSRSFFGRGAMLQREILVVLLVIGSLLLLGASGFHTLSGLRAYVGAEALWTKGQQEATYRLLSYVYSGNESEFDLFAESLTVPLGDRVARLELDSPDPRMDVVRQGFLDGGNHPDDIKALITLYRIFKDVSPVDKAVDQWAIADSLIAELVILGETIHQRSLQGPLDEATRFAFSADIDALQKGLTAAETQFSLNMSLAARKASSILVTAMLVLALVGAVVCVLMLRMTGSLVKRLGDSEERFRRLAENAPDVIYRMAIPSGQYEYMSPAAEKVLGHAPEAFYAQPKLIADIIHPDWYGYFEREWEKLLRGEFNPTYEYQIILNSGETRWVNQRNVLLRDENDEVIAIEGIVTDVTDRKSWDQEREKLARELRAAHKLEAIGTLAGGIAHDFNNILSSILGNTEMARRGVADHSETGRHLDEVLAACHRARDLVRRILTVSKGEMQDRQNVRVQPLIDEALSLLRASLPANITIVAEVPGECGAVLAEPTQIHQVILNLCTNAAQAMADQGGVIKVTLEDIVVDSVAENEGSSTEFGEFLKLTVKDSGPGIPPEVRERIFDPYFTTKPMGEGSGMGLAVVKGIVVNYGGTITAENCPEGGSLFTVTLPRVEPVGESHREEMPRPLAGTERILFIDDEPSLAELNRRQLESLGFQVTAMTSSERALEIFTEAPELYDLVVTDQTMPEMTGDQLARAILEVKSDTPIILCTGFSQAVDEDKAQKIGIRAFLMKPYKRDELVALVRKVLDEQEL